MLRNRFRSFALPTGVLFAVTATFAEPEKPVSW